MEIKITSKEKQELFNRDTIKFRISHEKQSTPSREDVKKMLSKEVRSDFIIIDNINSKFGLGISFGEARIYEDEKQMKEMEPEHLLKRHEKKTKEKQEPEEKQEKKEKKPEKEKSEEKQAKEEKK